MLDALYVFSSEWPDLPLSESMADHPKLHSRLTELQAHTLLGVDFSAHEVWTREEIRQHLGEVARKLNAAAVAVYPSRLSEDGCFQHYEYVKGGK